VALTPLTHTLFSGHASHSQPPIGFVGLAICSNPGAHEHAEPFQDELAGQTHSVSAAEPGRE